MSSDATQLALIMGTKALIDVTHASQTKGRDPMVTLVSNGLLFGGLAIFAGVTKLDRLAMALAYVMLLAALLFRGIPLLELNTGLVSATRNRGSASSNSTASGSGGKGSAGGGGGGGTGGGL